MTVQLDLFAVSSQETWAEGGLIFTGEPFWLEQWPPCDLDGSLRYYQCAQDHGIDACCSVVYRLTHPVHRRDLRACSEWPCNGVRCTRR